MTREAIFEVVRDQILSVLPFVPREQITLEKRLEDFGADSVDRSDISTGVADTLGLEVPYVKLGEAKDIRALVELAYSHQPG